MSLSNERRFATLGRGAALLLTEGAHEGLEQEERLSPWQKQFRTHCSRLSQILVRRRLKSVPMFLSTQPQHG